MKDCPLIMFANGQYFTNDRWDKEKETVHLHHGQLHLSPICEHNKVSKLRNYFLQIRLVNGL